MVKLILAKPEEWNFLVFQSSSIHPSDDGHQFGDLPTLIGFVSAGDRMLDAMSDVIPQDLLLNPSECGTNRRDLRYNIDAIAVFLHHFRKTADLALDPAEAFLA